LNCYHCWARNIRSINALGNHINENQGLGNVFRDSYFYGSQGDGSSSYGIQLERSSSDLIENNIFQQVDTPIMFGNGSGSIVGYNFTVDNLFGATTSTFMGASYYDHNAGSEMNLWEGNSMANFVTDSATWGSSTQGTVFRNMLTGWQTGKTQSTFALFLNSYSRAFNVIGNVLGQPGYHTHYQSYVTSSSRGVNGGSGLSKSVFGFGWFTGSGGCGTPGTQPPCDPLVLSTAMLWGNYDTVNAAVQWNSTLASPGAVPYVNANFTPSYFSSLAQTLPSSLYYNSSPSWWPAGKAWPPVGPDVSSGNLGICTGTYAGAQATAPSQCTGGGWSSKWAAHANSIPAQDCYLNVMGGPPDGSGNLLNFDAKQCYGTGRPTGVMVTAQ
jgi:hypothetical protein